MTLPRVCKKGRFFTDPPKFRSGSLLFRFFWSSGSQEHCSKHRNIFQKPVLSLLIVFNFYGTLPSCSVLLLPTAEQNLPLPAGSAFSLKRRLFKACRGKTNSSAGYLPIFKVYSHRAVLLRNAAPKRRNARNALCISDIHRHLLRRYRRRMRGNFFGAPGICFRSSAG